MEILQYKITNRPWGEECQFTVRWNGIEINDIVTPDGTDLEVLILERAQRIIDGYNNFSE